MVEDVAEIPAERISGPARIVHLLEVLSASDGSLRLADLSRRTGLPLTTAHRLTSELLRLGVIERDADGRYTVGLRLWELASKAPRSVALREAALPFLEDLYEATHANVQLAVRDGAELVYVERITGRHAVEVKTRVGLRFAMPATGVGLVLLAFADDDVREEVLAQQISTYTSRTITDPAELRKAIAEVKSSGVAIAHSQVTDNAVSIAAPVRGPRGDVVAAVSIVAAESEVPLPHALAPVVVATARGISRRLREAGGS